MLSSSDGVEVLVGVEEATEQASTPRVSERNVAHLGNLLKQQFSSSNPDVFMQGGIPTIECGETDVTMRDCRQKRYREVCFHSAEKDWISVSVSDDRQVKAQIAFSDVDPQHGDLIAFYVSLALMKATEYDRKRRQASLVLATVKKRPVKNTKKTQAHNTLVPIAFRRGS